MTTETQTQPRGAGNGDKAAATRTRNIIDWPPEPKTHAEHVEELLTVSQDNEDFNNEMNALQVENVKRLKDVLSYPQGDPIADDEQRKQSREAYLASSDPEKRRAALKGEMDARAKRDRARVAATK